MIGLVLALAVVIGVTLGLLGGGGSILTVPVLVYVAGIEPKAAIATSLVVVGATAAAGAFSHARAGRVRWRTGLVFGAAGMGGAYAGGRAAEFIPGSWLLVAFGLMMAVTAVAMLRGSRRAVAADPRRELAFGRAVLDGAVVGLVTGLVGAGGGFLVVPALVLLGGLTMEVAIGTSLLVIAMKSAAGLLGYLHSVQIDWPLALGVTAAAIIGSVLGGRLVERVSAEALRRGFGWFVVVMAAFVLGQQVPADVRGAVLGHPATWAISAAALAGALIWRRRAQAAGRPGGTDGSAAAHPEPVSAPQTPARAPVSSPRR